MNEILIKEFVKNKLEKESSGHDYLHALRVYQNALMLVDETHQKDVILASCLIHDLIDHKLDRAFKASLEELSVLLEKAGLTNNEITHVFDIIQNISFSKGTTPDTIEGKIVQDADRLDALGAIGIARTFSFGGKHNRLIYHPDTLDGDDSRSHFYQKLLHLKDLMNTEQGYQEAVKRTKYMEEFLRQLERQVGELDV